MRCELALQDAASACGLETNRTRVRVKNRTRVRVRVRNRNKVRIIRVRAVARARVRVSVGFGVRGKVACSRIAARQAVRRARRAAPQRAAACM